MWLTDTRVLVTLLAASLSAPAEAKVEAGQIVPPLADFRLEGDLPKLHGHVVVLDVWASWCAPCKASFPALAKLHQEFSRRGVVVLGISVDENARQYAAFVRRHAPPFPVVRDQGLAFARSFEPPAMPTTYVIDRHGRVRRVHRGFQGESTVAELRNEVEQLLQEGP